MKLVKVHVQNYRSILDSGEIEIEKIKTVLVGINEAGKTALLKAINQLNPASEIEKVSLLRDFPRSKYAEHIKGQNIDELCKSTPLVSGTFILEPALLHKDLKCKAPLIEPNLRRNLGKWST